MRKFTRKPSVSKRNNSAKSSMPSRTLSRENPYMHSNRHLQRTIGNHAVQRLLQPKTGDSEAGPQSNISAKPASDFSGIPVLDSLHNDSKSTLKTNSPGDIYEREADRVADQVMNMTEAQVQGAYAFGDRLTHRNDHQLVANQTRPGTKHFPTLGAGQIPASPALHKELPTAGRHLDSATAQFMESRFGHGFGRVRIHTDTRAAESARAAQALAYTMGDNIVFSAGQYAPQTSKGRRLLAHELAHVVQQQGGTSAPRAGISRLSSAPIAPQRNDDLAELRARLTVVQARLRVLRAASQGSQDRFAAETLRERLDASQRQLEQNLRTQIIQQRGARQAFPHTGVATRVRSIASASRTDNLVTVSFPIQVAYLSLSAADAQRRVPADLQRIRDTIRDIWQVNIQSGEYAGIQFRVNPTVSYLPRGEARASNAFLIQVRSPDNAPSFGDGTTGTISLAFAHLARVRVVAHELAHLFGFTDTYMEAGRTAGGGRYGMSVVGRQQHPGQADLLGMIDPVVLARWRQEGTITAQQLALQSGPGTPLGRRSFSGTAHYRRPSASTAAPGPGQREL